MTASAALLIDIFNRSGQKQKTAKNGPDTYSKINPAYFGDRPKHFDRFG